MSTAPVFADLLSCYADTVDENTLMTDYWLSFVSVRRRDDERSNASPSTEPRPGLDSGAFSPGKSGVPFL